MTIANIIDAANEAQVLFKAAWGVRLAEYPNLKFTKPAISVTWARWTMSHADGAQATLSGPVGSRRFSRAGVILIEVYTPLGAGLKVPYDTAQIALGAYEGKRTPSDVWFRNCRIVDEGPGRGENKAWWCTQVAAEFEYETLK